MRSLSDQAAPHQLFLVTGPSLVPRPTGFCGITTSLAKSSSSCTAIFREFQILFGTVDLGCTDFIGNSDIQMLSMPRCAALNIICDAL